ncbi:MAG: hypothetical protein GYA35_08785, partial [Thermoanaerobaculaceae bacterium]|nr:hypothetical protein [Thermoanaerobaculaceae bacterium]
AGDVNGDGYSDVIVGSYNYNSGRGKAYLYYGSAFGLSSSAGWTKEGEIAGGYFGISASTAGDVNGDGYSDIIIGAFGCNSGAGRTYLYCGGSTGLSSSPSWIRNGENMSDMFGATVATAGDVNGDGYSDVLVNAYGFNLNSGRAYLFNGSASGLTLTPSWVATGEGINNYFGRAIATAGDVNGDGYSDVIAGAWGYNSETGKAYLYLGGPSGLSSSPSWVKTGETTYSRYGLPAVSAGDVNGDGFSDVLIGADRFSDYQGKAYLYLGSASGLSSPHSWSGSGPGENSCYGYVSGAGDVNGDGYGDIVVGAYYAPGDGTGMAFFYYGNGGAGVTVKPMQMRNDLTAPIPVGGNAYEQKLRLCLKLRSPIGKVWSKMEWQIAPWGSTFSPSVNPIQADTSWYYNPVYRTVPITLDEDKQRYTWRVRIKYHPAKSPFIPFSPWFTLSSNGLYEADIKSTSAAEPNPPSQCIPPDEPCWLYLVTKDGTNYTLNWQDPNQTNQRTGWNIRRSNNASLPKDTWPLVGSNVVDMDQGTANYQWTDHSGDDPSPSSIWYYQVTTYNNNCPAEGPF